MLKSLLTGVCLAAALAASSGHADNPAPNPPPTVSQFSDISAHDQVRQMGRGVNIIGYDPFWQDGGKGNYTEKHFAEIKAAGFSTVRVVLFTFKFLDGDNTLDPKWLNRLDWVVANAKKNGLTVILDEHDFDSCSKDIAACTPKLKAVWSQLAERYRNEPNTVVFELMNEPHGQFDAATWNATFPEVLAVIRKTNPKRNVIIGGVQWNSRNTLKDLKLPEDDRHIIATFHYYDPFHFTHQGAAWAPPEITKLKDIRFGTPEQIAQVDADFKAVSDWSKANDRPVLLGEFGAYDAAAMEDRVLWTSTVARTAEKYGFAFGYWQFSSDFLLYDFKTQSFVKPILKALVPETK
ncbi:MULTISPECIES: glycoside hydrolase family 5 protein [Asticcacaulis]|uniref:glycoside hydrolase family 5 protein n=1 Tax=Asticcacaulis TaxID=76890 RepID=UPI001AE1DB6B|nr:MULTISPECIES: glycoside hydrolase family 5 protein [Asticcacaulis]MBP2160642.1 endoglucanase [Asticcacaulis solisilvae]MDR6801687.1 endoglucanase [Asticcacaulis sp. BE141]